MTRTTRFLPAFLALALIAGGLSACAAPTATPTPVRAILEQGRHPFFARTESSLGTVVEWRGYQDGHRPGKTSAVELRLTNNREEVWQGRYCIQLVDQFHMQASLAQQDFVLGPAGSRSERAELRFPTGLPEGHYGLVLVTHRPSGPSVEVAYIEVAAGTDSPLPPGVVISPQAVEMARQACPPAVGGLS